MPTDALARDCRGSRRSSRSFQLHSVRGVPSRELARADRAATGISSRTISAACHRSRSASMTARRSPGSRIRRRRADRRRGRGRRHPGGAVRADLLRVHPRAVHGIGGGDDGPGDAGPGRPAGWKRWEPAIQSLCSGREIYGAGVGGRYWIGRKPLDLRRSFAADDDTRRCARTSDRGLPARQGRVHRRRRSRLRRRGRAVRAQTTPGDPFSWWSVNAAGHEVVTRINDSGASRTRCRRSRTTRASLRFARLAGPDLRVCDDRLDGPMVFIKNANVVKGNGDLRWHVDDGIGGHPVMCPLIQAGIQLDPANAGERPAPPARRLASLHEALDRVGRRRRPPRRRARDRAR